MALFEHSRNGWKIEQQELSKPGKVRAKVDDVTLWVERDPESGKWILSSAEYARRQEGKRPVQFNLVSHADLQLGRPGEHTSGLIEALRAYWEEWRKSKGGVLERLAALEESEKAINADVEPEEAPS